MCRVGVRERHFIVSPTRLALARKSAAELGTLPTLAALAGGGMGTVSFSARRVNLSQLKSLSEIRKPCFNPLVPPRQGGR